MANEQLADGIAVTVDAPAIAATTAVNSTAVDMAGYTGVLFIVRIGTAAANNNIRAQQDTDSGMASAADLTGTLVASGANTVMILEVRDSREQYLRCVVTRGTSTTVDSITAIRYGARQRPVSFPSTQSFESWTYAAEGTA